MSSAAVAKPKYNGSLALMHPEFKVPFTVAAPTLEQAALSCTYLKDILGSNLTLGPLTRNVLQKFGSSFRVRTTYKLLSIEAAMGLEIERSTDVPYYYISVWPVNCRIAQVRQMAMPNYTLIRVINRDVLGHLESFYRDKETGSQILMSINYHPLPKKAPCREYIFSQKPTGIQLDQQVRRS